jgi:hypothetical protein
MDKVIRGAREGAYRAEFLSSHRRLIEIFQQGGAEAVLQFLRQVWEDAAAIAHFEADSRRAIKGFRAMLTMRSLDWQPEMWCASALVASAIEMQDPVALATKSDEILARSHKARNTAMVHGLPSRHLNANLDLAVLLIMRRNATPAALDEAATLAEEAISLFNSGG